jgi:ATP-dependent DNA ligase
VPLSLTSRGRSRLSTMRSSSRATRVAGAVAPLQVPKMLAAGWLHEIKYNGYRKHARIDSSDITLLARTGLDCTIE